MDYCSEFKNKIFECDKTEPLFNERTLIVASTVGRSPKIRKLIDELFICESVDLSKTKMPLIPGIVGFNFTELLYAQKTYHLLVSKKLPFSVVMCAFDDFIKKINLLDIKEGEAIDLAGLMIHHYKHDIGLKEATIFMFWNGYVIPKEICKFCKIPCRTDDEVEESLPGWIDRYTLKTDDKRRIKAKLAGPTEREIISQIKEMVPLSFKKLSDFVSGAAPIFLSESESMLADEIIVNQYINKKDVEDAIYAYMVAAAGNRPEDILIDEPYLTDAEEMLNAETLITNLISLSIAYKRVVRALRSTQNLATSYALQLEGTNKRLVKERSKITTDEKECLEQKIGILNTDKKNLLSENEKLQKEVKRLKAQVKELEGSKVELSKLREKFFSLNDDQSKEFEDINSEASIARSKENLSKLENRNILFFGGHVNLTAKLKNAAPTVNVIGQQSFSSSLLKEADIICIYASQIGHAQYYKIMSCCDHNKVKYVSSTNIDRLLDEIAN
jgi:hypothetical protein